MDDQTKTSVNKKIWINRGMQALIWLIVFLLPFIFLSKMSGGTNAQNKERSEFLYLITCLNCFWLALFYFNSAVLIPRLIYKRKTAGYLVTIFGIFCLMVLLDRILFMIFIHEHEFTIYNSIRHNFIPFVFTIAVSSAYKAISDKTKADITIREKESENLKTELSFLRSQISPHFLFNVLNNIVALVRLNSNELEPTILKLSSLMQYMLYETDEEKVVVKSEADYLQNYIDLQKQRFGPELSLRVNFDILEDWHTIEPMLLIPFVENAFKHGNGVIHTPEIEINLKVENGHLDFMVKNKFEDSKAIKDKTSGIGLQNVKRRLELLYPGKHKLWISQKDGSFIINLHLTLQ